MAPGYRYRYLTDEGQFELEVTAFTPGRGFAARTLSGPMSWEGRFEVEAAGETASRVSSVGQIRLGGVKRLAEPFLGGEIRRREQAELDRLKALVEGTAG